MTANFDPDDPIARRIRGQFSPPTAGDLVKAAAWELEREFAEDATPLGSTACPCKCVDSPLNRRHVAVGANHRRTLMNKTTTADEARKVYDDLSKELAETEAAHKKLSAKLVDLRQRTEGARVHANKLANAPA